MTKYINNNDDNNSRKRDNSWVSCNDVKSDLEIYSDTNDTEISDNNSKIKFRNCKQENVKPTSISNYSLQRNNSNSCFWKNRKY